MLGILFSSILVKFNLLINKSYDQSFGIVLNFGNFYKSVNHYTINWVNEIYYYLRWLNTVLAVCEYMSFAKSWQEKGCSSQAETWQVKNILIKDFD